MNFSFASPEDVMRFSLAAHAEAALPANDDTYTYGLVFSDKEQVYIIAQYKDGMLVGYGLR